MKENYPSKRLSIFALLAVCVLLLANSSNPPNGRTGAPGDSGTCVSCHTGNNPNGYNGSIVIDNFPSSITPGNSYNLTARVSNPNGLAVRGGFQAVVLNESAGNTNAGDISVSGSNPSTVMSNAREYVEHNPAKFFPANNEVTWDFNWTAPNAAPGNVIKIYAASVIGNGGGSSGDLVVTSVASGTIANNADPLMVTVATTDVLCAGDCNGTATPTIEGGTPPYTLAWTPTGGNADILTDLCPGDYTLFVTDDDNQTASANFTIGEPAPILAITSAIDETVAGANDGTATVTQSGGTAPLSFISWSNGGNTSTISNLAPDTYCVTITDNNGCTASDCITVNAGDCNLSISYTFGNASCYGVCDGYIFPEVTGGTDPLTYIWSNNGVTSNLIYLCAGNYGLTVTDAANCTASISVDITQPDSIIANAVVSPESAVAAMDGAIQTNATGGVGNYSYLWSTGATTSGISNLPAGNYCVTISDGIQCQEVYCYEVIQFDCEDIVINTTVVENTCPGECLGSIETSITGGISTYTYLWSNGATTPNINNLCDGTYTLVITNEFGCQYAQTEVLNSGVLMMNEATVTDAGCFGDCSGTITVNTTAGTSPFSYDWNEDAFDGMTSVSGVCAGAYDLTVTDGNGCTELLCFEVDAFDELLVNTTVSEFVCFGECNGTVTIEVTGGTPPYVLSSTGPLEDLCAGDYNFVITDSEGCSVLGEFTILENPALEIFVSDIINETNGQGNGSATVATIGGVQPYSYSWLLDGVEVSNSNAPDNLTSGTYTVVATDVNGCTISQDVIIENLVNTSDHDISGTLQLYPNPAGETVHILLEKPLSDAATLTVHNIHGQEVSNQLNQQRQAKGWNLELRNLPTGIYTIIIRDGNQRWQERLVKT